MRAYIDVRSGAKGRRFKDLLHPGTRRATLDPRVAELEQRLGIHLREGGRSAVCGTGGKFYQDCGVLAMVGPLDG